MNKEETIKQLKEILPGAHYTNIVVRFNGQDRVFEADWLLELLTQNA